MWEQCRITDGKIIILQKCCQYLNVRFQHPNFNLQKCSISLIDARQKMIQKQGIVYSNQLNRTIISKKYQHLDEIVVYLTFKKLMSIYKIGCHTQNKILGLDAIVYKDHYIFEKQTLLSVEELIYFCGFNLIKKSEIKQAIKGGVEDLHSIGIFHGNLDIKCFGYSASSNKIVIQQFEIYQIINDKAINYQILFNKDLKSIEEIIKSIDLFIYSQKYLHSNISEQKKQYKKVISRRLQYAYCQHNQNTEDLCKKIQNQILYSFCLLPNFSQFQRKYYQIKSNQINSAISKQLIKFLVQIYKFNDNPDILKLYKLIFVEQQTQISRLNVFYHQGKQQNQKNNNQILEYLGWIQAQLTFRFYHSQNNFRQVMQRYIKILQKYNFQQFTLKISFYQALLFAMENKYYLSINYLLAILKLQLTQEQRVIIYNQIGIVYGQIGETKLQVQYFLKSLQLNTQINGLYSKKSLSILHNLTLIYQKLNNTEKSCEYKDKIRNIQVFNQTISIKSSLKKINQLKQSIHNRKANLQTQNLQEQNSLKLQFNRMYQTVKQRIKFIQIQYIPEYYYGQLQLLFSTAQFYRLCLNEQNVTLQQVQLTIQKLKNINQYTYYKLLYLYCLISEKEGKIQESVKFLTEIKIFYDNLNENISGFIKYQILRLYIFHNKKEQFWYKQNILPIKQYLQGEFLLGYIRMCFQRQNYTQCLHYSSIYFQQNPHNIECLLMLIFCHKLHKQYLMALEIFENNKQILIKQPLIVEMMMEVYLELQQYSKGLKLLSFLQSQHLNYPLKSGYYIGTKCMIKLNFSSNQIQKMFDKYLDLINQEIIDGQIEILELYLMIKCNQNITKKIDILTKILKYYEKCNFKQKYYHFSLNLMQCYSELMNHSQWNWCLNNIIIHYSNYIDKKMIQILMESKQKRLLELKDCVNIYKAIDQNYGIYSNECLLVLQLLLDIIKYNNVCQICILITLLRIQKLSKRSDQQQQINQLFKKVLNYSRSGVPILMIDEIKQVRQLDTNYNKVIKIIRCYEQLIKWYTNKQGLDLQENLKMKEKVEELLLLYQTQIAYQGSFNQEISNLYNQIHEL